MKATRKVICRVLFAVLLCGAAGAEAGKPYEVAAHWVALQTRFAPIWRDFMFNDLAWQGPYKGWIAGDRLVLHIRDDELKLVMINDDSASVATVAVDTLGTVWMAGTRRQKARGQVAQGVIWRRSLSGDWAEVELPRAGARNWGISDMIFAKPDDGWAIVSPDALLELQENTELLHYDGKRWSTASMAPEVALTDLALCSTHEQWAVGRTVIHELPAKGIVLRYSDGSWRHDRLPQLRGDEDWGLFQVKCAADGSVFAGGNRASRVDDRIEYSGVLLRYCGRSWEHVSLPEKSFTLSAVAPLSCDEFWLAGDDSGGTQFLHYSNDRWRTVPPPVLPGNRMSGFSIRGLHFDGPDDGWAIANDGDGPGVIRGVIFRYRDGKWRNQNWSWHFWHERNLGLF